MNPKRRILFILHLPPPVHGAAVVGRQIRDSAIVNDAFDCRYINLATAASLEDIGRFRLSKITRFTSLLRRIMAGIRSFKPDVVYITPNAAGAAFYKDWLTVSLLRLASVPIVAHFHNKGVEANSHRAINRALYRSFFRGIDVILLSGRLYPDIRRYVPQQRVHYCPNGITPPDSNSLPSRPQPSRPQPSASTLSAAQDTPRLLFLSNLLIAKGILDFLDAAAILHGRGYGFACDIVGAESADIDRPRLDAEIHRRGIDGIVTVHGPKYGNDKEQILANSDIFVFPSYNEAFPLVCLEAMAHSLPTVATDEGGIPDIIDHGSTGFIVPKKDSEALADAIARLLDDPDLRHSMGEAGRQRFLRLFTAQAFECRLRDILASI